MRSSYVKEDVIFLLKDITGWVQPQSTEERERLIQSGKHYCEMLPIEYTPSQQYLEVYQEALKHYAKPMAAAIGILADKIVETRGKAHSAGFFGKSRNTNWCFVETVLTVEVRNGSAALLYFYYSRERN